MPPTAQPMVMMISGIIEMRDVTESPMMRAAMTERGSTGCSTPSTIDAGAGTSATGGSGFRFDGRARIAHLFVIVHRVLARQLINFRSDRRGDFLTRVVELHRHRIDAVACVLVGQAFACEDVPQVAAAVAADDLDSPAVCIGFSMDGAFDLVVEARPATPGMKLVFRAVERSVAATTGIRAVSSRIRRIRPSPGSRCLCPG